MKKETISNAYYAPNRSGPGSGGGGGGGGDLNEELKSL